MLFPLTGLFFPLLFPQLASSHFSVFSLPPYLLITPCTPSLFLFPFVMLLFNICLPHLTVSVLLPPC